MKKKKSKRNPKFAKLPKEEKKKLVKFILKEIHEDIKKIAKNTGTKLD